MWRLPVRMIGLETRFDGVRRQPQRLPANG